MTEVAVKHLTCDRCLSGRHSVLCETNGCACNLCAKAKMASTVRRPKRKKYERRPGSSVPKTRIRTEEERQRRADAQRRYYREIHEFPLWSYNEDALAVKLGELFSNLHEKKHG